MNEYPTIKSNNFLPISDEPTTAIVLREENSIAVVETPEDDDEDDGEGDDVDGYHQHNKTKKFNRILRGSIKKRLTYIESLYKSYR